jgi:hypothetical protein
MNDIQVIMYIDGLRVKASNSKCPKIGMLQTLSKFDIYNFNGPHMQLMTAVNDNVFNYSVDIGEPSALVLDGEPYCILEESGVYNISVRFPKRGVHSMDVQLL